MKDKEVESIDREEKIRTELLKICLCRKYQEMYSDIDTLCERAGLSKYQAAIVKKWKQHNVGYCPDEIYNLLLYIEECEKERFNKALYIYNKNRGLDYPLSITL